MSTKQSENPFNFEENVRKTGKRIPRAVQAPNELGTHIEQIKARTQENLDERVSWDSPTERSPPTDEHNNFQDFVERTSRAIESRDSDLQSLEGVYDDANAEAYNSLLGLTEGAGPERALQSDERVVDHMRQRALKADEDKVVANKVRESVSENIDSLEQDLLNFQDNLTEGIAEYAEDFESYMNEMAAFTRDEYGALAEMANQLSHVDELEADSELGETVIDHIEHDLVESIESQSRKVADAYNQMVDAYEATDQMNESLPSDLRERYEMDVQRLDDALDRSDQIFDNMGGCYDSFEERAEDMMEETLADTETVDAGIMEAWGNDYSAPEGEFKRG